MHLSATDCWKACKAHCATGHILQRCTMADFADYLAVALLNNNLSEMPLAVRASGRKRDFGTNVTNLAPVFALNTAPEDLSAVAGHTMASCGRTGEKTKQLRCRWCSVKEDKVCWTSHYCEECGFGLCAPNNRHSRKCWVLHTTCSLQELRCVMARRRD